MVKSMTGYGCATGSCDGMKLTVEIKGVNNRFLDCSVRLPRNFLFAEETVKAKIQERISRGKLDVFVSAESAEALDVAVKINEGLAEEYARAIAALSEQFHTKNDLTAVTLGRFPDVLSVEKKEMDKDAVNTSLCAITQSAIDEFESMRSREGEKLSEDITARLATIEDYVTQVEQRSPETVTEYRNRLFAKMREVLESAGVDEQRILTEAAIYADKIAVDEETVRLRSHISQMRDMLEGASPIGRKMDFLIQEFNREANTIGSKCNDSEIARTVIELKGEIEKIREQVQNIE